VYCVQSERGMAELDDAQDLALPLGVPWTFMAGINATATRCEFDQRPSTSLPSLSPYGGEQGDENDLMVVSSLLLSTSKLGGEWGARRNPSLRTNGGGRRSALPSVQTGQNPPPRHLHTVQYNAKDAITIDNTKVVEPTLEGWNHG
jgi:hypothetical protein